MTYALAIDWLKIFCIYMGADEWEPISSVRFTYMRETYGTRCFSRLYRVRMPNSEGGMDEFAEIEATPYSSILPEYAVMVRFVNRALYLPDFWELAEELLTENNFQCKGISRIDICADFNEFAEINPKALIEGFAAKRLRHIGRGVGALYFNHGKGAERDEFGKPKPDYGVNYTGLSFGTHSSDAHVYLYNKTFELLTQGDKPWIKDTWVAAGLDVRNVWRLEVSIKSQGLKFKDRASGQKVEVDVPMVYDTHELDKIYHTFVRKLFAFIRNKSQIKNVTREPRIVLFDDTLPAYDRGAIRNISAGDRMERILIKSLYQFADRYRGRYIYEARERAQSLAASLAYGTGLGEWYEDKINQWETPIHK